jgi:sugar-specific transcriptional regulator TrmB
MVENESLVDILRKFGLTEYEAKVYLALVSLGPSSGKEISQATGIVYSKIYNILNSLIQKGWISYRDDERPKIYVPNPPDIVLSESKKRILDSVSRSLDEGMRKALRDLKPLFERNISSYKPEVLSFVGEKSIIAILESNIRNSHEVCGTFESNRRADIDTILNILKTAKSDVKLIIKSSLKLDIPDDFDVVVVDKECLHDTSFGFFVFDSRRVVVVRFPTIKGELIVDAGFGLLVDEKYLAEWLRNVILKNWAEHKNTGNNKGDLRCSESYVS